MFDSEIENIRLKTRIETAKQIDKKFKGTDFYNKISVKQQEKYNKIMAEFLQEKDND